ncbi:2Fe-2S iron-sulfur cluster-binding protein [Streptomyces sp. NPDC048566]|uniref:2Fe-2S iron-sulfur cluster-binding protein n=1 Tax=Streptomyces sp. NPDC048566 TaxID=3365569 RepID=UPI00370FAC0A
MTDDRHEDGSGRGGGRWDPLPQGDYDDGATAFVELPEGGIEALLASREPLAAPGHGYVPPEIDAVPAAPDAADPAADGAWDTRGGGSWPDPDAGQPGAGAHDDRFAYTPGATGPWDYSGYGAAPGEPGYGAAAGDGHDDAYRGAHGAGQDTGHDVTGQWSIPVAGGDLPDESGEFTTSALVEQWGGAPPATLPGGASAPWASEIGQAWTAEPREGSSAAPEPSAPPVPPLPRSEALQQPAEAAREAAGFAPDDPASEHPEASAGHEEPEEPGTPEDPAPEPADTAPREPEDTGDAGSGAEEPSSPEPEPEPVPGALDGPVADDAEPLPEPLVIAPHDDHPLASYVLRVNGADRPVTDAWIGESLLYVLRERLGLAGAKDGCSQGECGACNVQVDGRLVASCLVPGVTAAGSDVRTVEGLAADGQPSDVQRALAKCGAVQCGFCVPGMAMTLHDLLEGNPAPTELETRQALCGNLCRCSGYRGVLDAVREVVAEREHASSAADAPEADEARIPHQAGPGAGGVHPSAYEDDGAYGQAPHEQPYGQDGGQA